MHALVTGGAGFIGSHLVDRLLAADWQVTCLDNFDALYSRALKEENIAGHRAHGNYRLLQHDICDPENLTSEVREHVDVIFHLAAKAGVRPSIQNPVAYQDVNVRGTQNVLEFARERDVEQFVFASSSSVYGVNPNVPWREDDPVLLPISPYAATKVSGELLGHVYSHLHGIRFVALRFFTVYGPRQRPDLAIHKMARLMLCGEPVPVYGDGTARRDYTWVDDIVDGILGAARYITTKFEVINLGNNSTVSTLEMVRTLEETLGVKAKVRFEPEQPGDVPRTWADISKASALLGYRPMQPFQEGIEAFVRWVTATRP